MSNRKDNLFQSSFVREGEFRFDEKVAQVFPDMVRRSIPGYGQVIGLSALIAKRYARPNTAIYDLGCSLGATTLAMANQIRTQGCRIIAVDNSEAMLNHARRTAADRFLDPLHIAWVCRDIVDIPLEPCSVVAMNFTLQFIALEKRNELLTSIKKALVPGGVLVLAEKVICKHNQSQQALNELHLDFKRANGYSELEIASKRQAIENVLIPETSEAHISRLHDAGFSAVIEFFHCLNFKAWMAIA